MVPAFSHLKGTKQEGFIEHLLNVYHGNQQTSGAIDFTESSRTLGISLRTAWSIKVSLDHVLLFID